MKTKTPRQVMSRREMYGTVNAMWLADIRELLSSVTGDVADVCSLALAGDRKAFASCKQIIRELEKA